MDAGKARSRSRLPFAPWSLLLTLCERQRGLGKMRAEPGKPIEAAYSRRPATIRAGAGAFCTRGVGFVALMCIFSLLRTSPPGSPLPHVRARRR